MSRSASGSTRWRAHGAAAVSLGLMFAGPVWSGVPEPEPLQSEVTAMEVPAGTLANLPAGPTLGAVGVFIDEAESNDTSATAQVLPTMPIRVRGNLFRQPFLAGNIDVDVYAFTASAGDRVYAATMTGWSAGSQDSELDILDTDGTTVLELDDDDGSVGTLSSNVAGVVLPAAGTYYVRVRQGSVTAISGTIRPYDLYVNVVSGTPGVEVEPNNAPAQATPLPANGWIRGVVDPAADTEWFSFSVNAGDTIVAVLDVDPERDAPDWNARLGIGIFNNFFLIIDNTTAAADTNPSEAFFMTARTTGTHYVYVDATGGLGGPTFTYNLSVMVIPAKPLTCTSYTGTTGAIADAGSTDFTINATDARLIESVKVGLAITHPATVDLDVTLISPDGNESEIFDDPPTGTGAAPQINAVFEDEAGIPLSTGFSVHSGMHLIPDAPGRMEFFKGMQAQGTWILRVRDDLAGLVGTVDTLSLTVCEAAPRPACVVPGPAETTLYESDFEVDDGGFTHNGVQDEWERGLPAFAPITTAHSGTNAWKTDLDNTYNATSNQNLVSPGIDLSGVTGRITLTWWQKFNIETPSFDRYWVVVQEVGNPASARRVFDWMGATMQDGLGTPLVTVPFSWGWAQRQADVSDFAGSIVEVIYHVETDGSVQLTGVAVDDVRVSSCAQVAGAAPEALAVDTAGNSVFEPNETVTMAPTWRNTHTVAFGLTGTLSNHIGPGTGTYGIPDTDASYGTINAGAAASCTTTGDCYSVSNTMTSRPATHWDSTVDEDVTGGPDPITKTWTLHIGDSFSDVPAANLFYRFIETLLHRGVTGGCTTSTYCPTSSTTREQMAVFVLVSKDQAAPPPPACVAGSEMFADVPAASPFCRWIEELAVRGVVSGCGGGNYCPLSTATREAMAVFVLRTLDGTLNPPACVAGSEMFSDVPATSVFCRWIEELARRAVVTGCGGGNYCPTADVSREQMSVFLSVTFGLALYGI